MSFGMTHYRRHKNIQIKSMPHSTPQPTRYQQGKKRREMRDKSNSKESHNMEKKFVPAQVQQPPIVQPDFPRQHAHLDWPKIH